MNLPSYSYALGNLSLPEFPLVLSDHLFSTFLYAFAHVNLEAARIQMGRVKEFFFPFKILSTIFFRGWVRECARVCVIF